MSDDSSKASDNEEKSTTQPTTIADDIVVTKYKMASDITNRNREREKFTLHKKNMQPQNDIFFLFLFFVRNIKGAG